jgi:hypothetical protein
LHSKQWLVTTGVGMTAGTAVEWQQKSLFGVAHFHCVSFLIGASDNFELKR